MAALTPEPEPEPEPLPDPDGAPSEPLSLAAMTNRVLRATWKYEPPEPPADPDGADPPDLAWWYRARRRRALTERERRQCAQFARGLAGRMLGDTVH